MDSSAGSPPIPITLTGPAPLADEHSAPFWQALTERRVLLQQCATCARPRFPRMPACPHCGAPGGDDIEVDATGVVYSFVRAHRALTPAFAELAPYAVAAVDLDGGGRIFGRVVPSSAAAIGLRVEPAFADHPATAAGAAWTELCFRPADRDQAAPPPAQ